MTTDSIGNVVYGYGVCPYVCPFRQINGYCSLTACQNPKYNGSGTYIIKTISKNADELKKRTGIIRKKLASAGEMSLEEADRILIGDDDPSYGNSSVLLPD